MLDIFYTVGMCSLVIFERVYVFLEKPQRLQKNRKLKQKKRERERNLPGLTSPMQPPGGPSGRPSPPPQPPCRLPHWTEGRARARRALATRLASSCLPLSPDARDALDVDTRPPRPPLTLSRALPLLCSSLPLVPSAAVATDAVRRGHRPPLASPMPPEEPPRLLLRLHQPM